MASDYNIIYHEKLLHIILTIKLSWVLIHYGRQFCKQLTYSKPRKHVSLSQIIMITIDNSTTEPIDNINICTYIIYDHYGLKLRLLADGQHYTALLFNFSSKR